MDDEKYNPDSWKILDTEEIFNTPFARFRADKLELPNGKIQPKYYVWEFADWVNVVPITKEGQLVLLKQYRHARREYIIEVPGGALEPKDGTGPEAIQAAALREMEEETGYKAGQVEHLLSHCPNPAVQNNMIHTFLATDCEWARPQDLDPYEEIDVFLASWEEALELAMSGKVNHSIVLASLFAAHQYLQAKN